MIRRTMHSSQSGTFNAKAGLTVVKGSNDTVTTARLATARATINTTTGKTTNSAKILRSMTGPPGEPLVTRKRATEKTPARELVYRFRSSQDFAAHSFTSFGIEGH